MHKRSLNTAKDLLFSEGAFIYSQKHRAFHPVYVPTEGTTITVPAHLARHPDLFGAICEKLLTITSDTIGARLLGDVVEFSAYFGVDRLQLPPEVLEDSGLYLTDEGRWT